MKKVLVFIFMLTPFWGFAQTPRTAEMTKVLEQLRIYYSSHNDSLEPLLETAKSLAEAQKDYPALVEVYKTQGAAQFLAGDFTKAFNTYSAGIKIGEEHKVKNELVIIYYEFSGLLSKSSNNNSELATQYIKKGLAFAQKLKDTAALADGNNRLGIMMGKLGKFDSARYYYQISYHFNDLKKDSLGISYSLENLASIYAQQKNFPLAIENMKASLHLRQLKNDQYGIAMANINISEVYKDAKQLDSALLYARRAEVAGRAVGFIDLVQYTYEHICNIYKQQKKYDIALLYHEKYTSLKDSIYNASNAKHLSELSAKYETAKKEKEIQVLNKQKTIQKLALTATLLLLAIMIIVAYIIFKNRKQKEEKLKSESLFQLQLQEVEARNALQHERLRISRELHDNIGAHLTFINATVENDSNDPQKMQQVKDLTNDTIRELRKTVWLINKSTVGIEEFVLKLRDFFKNIPHLQLTSTIANPQAILRAEQITELFRATQESVNNALKYANANQLSVAVIASQQQIQIIITDNGQGFDLGEKAHTGFGLQNMQHRMQSLQGSYHIQSQKGHGTTVTLSCPIA